MSFACTLCNHESILVRVSYRVNDQLFTGVPTYVCTNPGCVVNRGGQVYEHRTINRPPSETEMGHGQSAVQTESERDHLICKYDEWVAEGKPGFFGEWLDPGGEYAD